ncbi:MAG: hypothetical protein ACYCY7_02935 [Gallionella sp.]
MDIDASIIRDTLAVIANEVKQSSKTKMHFFNPSGLPRRLRLLMELLANRLSQQAGKSLVIAMTGYYWIATSASPLPRFARS